MAKHISLRLAWHNNGWSGHICDDPASNTYCIGKHSYPGDLISHSRDLEWEKENAGKNCCSLKGTPACCFSINAFGTEQIMGHSEPPDWFNGEAKGVDISIPPATVGAWNYENMYSDDVTSAAVDGRKYDNTVRFENARKFFDGFEKDKSLVFYYANYSNPFSEDETQKYVVVGISRIKKIGDFNYYNEPSENISKNYANGVVWQRLITSHYPEQGFHIPFEKYTGNDVVLERLALIPENTSAFKYGTREITDDDAIYLIWRFIEIVDVLIEIGDTTENWSVRKEWLNILLAELWKSRGAYPGLANVLSIVGLGELVSLYLSAVEKNTYKSFYEDFCKFIEGDTTIINGITISPSTIMIVQRNFALRDDDEREVLTKLLPRFDLSKEQMENVLSLDRRKNNIYATLKEIAENPYIIYEQYIGDENDDAISIYKIDNGVLPSPNLGIEKISSVDSPERLRAFCVSELKAIAAHSFGSAITILKNINKRLSAMQEWKSHQYVLKNFTIKMDLNIYEEALYLRKKDDGELFLYLKDVYQDERIIEKTLKELAGRSNISIKVPITKEKFYEKLNTNERLMRDAKDEYEKALDSQSEICYKLFLKPLSVISGSAGTGKTTILKSIISNIERVHGDATSILIMAPTGKATERIKNQTGKSSTTIHSFLAKKGWITDNLILKRADGERDNTVDTIIIDECSMIDLSLFATLVRAINWNSVKRLILVGDPNQLPPIGRGKVFSDIITWLRNEFPNNVGVLNVNIRQLANRVAGNGNGIIDLAEIYIQENQNITAQAKAHKEEILSKIQFSGEIDKDLSVYFWKTQDELELLIKKTMLKDMQKDTGKENVEGKEYLLWDSACKTNFSDINNPLLDKSTAYQQLISPYRGETYGTEYINKFMQNLFNGFWAKKSTLDDIALYDKVIQFRNRPQSNPAYAYNLSSKKTIKKEVYNGEIGFVKPHGLDCNSKDYMWKKLKRFQVVFSGKEREGYCYNFGKELLKDENNRWIPEQKAEENLELAYVISVHKSQGSEFDRVYLIIPKRDSHLLSMELLYTAITRAQVNLTIFVEEDISTLLKMGRLEKSGIRRINSSVFEFNPLPEEFLYFNSWYEEGKNISTLTEYLVRSKSEMNIANILYMNEIDFKYEEPLFAKDGTMFLPDFTVIWRGDKYYWEHVGMLNNKDYAAHWEKKKKWYDKNFPERLITTFESKNQSDDIKGILCKYFGMNI